MAEKKDEAKVSEAKPKVSKVKIKTKDHILIRDVQIGEVLHKKGTPYPLTEIGRKYFKSLKYIN